uniref:C2H2-type domain-containing protein n=1 Tax=Plectus sambesii TaxID=2011161 RepID=A0A914URY4_9BILA
MSVDASAAVNARDFLVHRLVNSTATADNSDDSRRQSATLSDGEDHASSASSEDSGRSSGGDHQQQQHMNAAAAAAAAMANLNPATTLAGLANANQMYAAAFAHLAQMNLMNPAMTAGMLPMFAPSLYHRFFSFPNLDQLRAALQSPQQKSPMDRPSPMSMPEKTVAQTPSPSPRKRSNQTPKSKSTTMQAEDLSASPQKRARAVKRLAFTDDETSSPVSGMFIKEATSVPCAEQLQAEADLDDSAQFVEITEEARAEIAKIPNVIGDYVCSLCKVRYDDAFKLAQHRCPRIIHEEYRCPECDKVFSCPANLASHRRWHKPKDGFDASLECTICATRCETKKQLRAHIASHAHINAWNNADQLADTEKSTNENQATFDCRFCSETFSSSPSLTRHINKHHPNDRCNVILLNN